MFPLISSLLWFFYKVAFQVKIYGRENLPQKGGCILCANHKSNWDPPAILAMTSRKPAIMSKAELFKIPIIAQICRCMGAFPVKRGKNDVGAIRAAVGALRQNKALLIFPEGTRVRGNRKPRGNIGAIRLAVSAGVCIVPIGIGGKYHPFGGLTLRVGEPIDFSEYKGQKLTDEKMREIAAQLMQTIYALAEQK